MSDTPSSQAPISQYLTGRAVALSRPPTLVGRRAMTRIPVRSEEYKGKIALTNARDVRAANMGSIKSPPGGMFKTVSSGDLGSVEYTVERYGLQSQQRPIEWDARDQMKLVKPELSKRVREFQKVVISVQNHDEKRIADFFASATNWTYTTACAGIAGGAGKQWSDPTSDPIGDMRAIRNTFFLRNGCFPDSVRTSWEVVNALASHPDLVQAKINADGSAIVQGRFVTDAEVVAVIARIFSVPAADVIVGAAIADTANPGGSESVGNLWGDFFWVGCLKGGVPVVDGAEAEADTVAAYGIDEIGIPDALLPGMGTQAAAMNQGMALLGGEIREKLTYQSFAWHYSTEVVCSASLGQLTTDCVA